MNAEEPDQVLGAAARCPDEQFAGIPAGFAREEARPRKGAPFRASSFTVGGHAWVAVVTQLNTASDQLLDTTVNHLGASEASRTAGEEPFRGAVAVLRTARRHKLDDADRAYLARYQRIVWRALRVLFVWQNGDERLSPTATGLKASDDPLAPDQRLELSAIKNACIEALHGLSDDAYLPPSIRSSAQAEVHVRSQLNPALAKFGFKPVTNRAARIPWCRKRPSDGLWERAEYPRRIVLEVKHHENLDIPLAQVAQYLAMEKADLVLHVRVLNRDDAMEEPPRAENAKRLLEGACPALYLQPVRLPSLVALNERLVGWIAAELGTSCGASLTAEAQRDIAKRIVRKVEQVYCVEGQGMEAAETTTDSHTAPG